MKSIIILLVAVCCFVAAQESVDEEEHGYGNIPEPVENSDSDEVSGDAGDAGDAGEAAGAEDEAPAETDSDEGHHHHHHHHHHREHSSNDPFGKNKQVCRCQCNCGENRGPTERQIDTLIALVRLALRSQIGRPDSNPDNRGPSIKIPGIPGGISIGDIAGLLPRPNALDTIGATTAATPVTETKTTKDTKDAAKN